MSNLREVEVLGQAIFESQISEMFYLASVIILFYDYILTVKFEIEFVWGRAWNIGKVFYILARYCVFVDALTLAYFHFATGQSVSARTCSLVYQVSGWFIFGGSCLTQLILIFRTWVIWGKNRRVAIVLPILLVIGLIPLVYLTRIGLTSITFADVAELPIPRLQSCFVIKLHNVTILWDYVLMLGFETVILILTLIKAFQHYRHAIVINKHAIVIDRQAFMTNRQAFATANQAPPRLAPTLYGDGMLYYVYLLVLSIANGLVLALIEKKTGATLILMQRVFHAILTQRMLLHLRMEIARGLEATAAQGTAWNICTHDTPSPQPVNLYDIA